MVKDLTIIMRFSLILVALCLISDIIHGAADTCPRKCRRMIRSLNRKIRVLQNSIQGDGYELVFSAKSGSGTDLLDVWKAADAVNQDNPNADVFKSPLVEEWETRGVDVVRVEVLVAGDVKSYFVFDGRTSNKLNWFSKDKIISSSNGNLADKTTNFFSIDGHEPYDRHFYINANYGGCPNDGGWLVVVDGGSNPACSWMSKETKPYFMYCEGDGPCLSNDAPVGDTFRILVKFI